MKVRGAALVGAMVGVMAVTAPGAAAAGLKGTVVDREAKGTFVLATSKGKLVEARSKGRAPRVGTRVRLAGRRSRAGAFRAKRVVRVSRTSRARVRGVVVYSSRRARAYVLAGKGATVAIQDRSRRRAGAAAATSIPAPGTTVLADVSFDQDGELEQEDVRELDHEDDFELEGTLVGIDTGARTLTVALEELEELEELGEIADPTVTVGVPAAFDMSICELGQEIELEVAYDAASGYTLIDAGDSDSSQDQSHSDGESDSSWDQSVSNACGDYDSSHDESHGDGESDSSSDWSRDSGG